MAHHTSTSSTVQPGKFTPTQGSKGLIFVSIFIGIISFVIGYQVDQSPEKNLIWQGYLTAFFYFVSLALGGLFFTAIQHITKAGWSVPVRRIAESLTSFFPVAIIAAVIYLVFGTHKMYEWMHLDVVANDPLLAKKASYLNEKFFIVRTVIFFLLWYVFSKFIVGNSLKQDQSGDERLTTKNLPLSIIFIIIFALSYSLFGVDYLMSLSPHWFSTMFGVYCFAGLFQSTLAFITILLVWLMKRGLLNGIVNENHLHDMGKFMFAFTVFYAYIAFSQFMLIWYANLPEETVFFASRGTGGWMWVSMCLLIFKFIVPFLLLLPRAAKRDGAHLTRVGILLLVVQYVDWFWLISPNFSETAFMPIWGVGIFFGFLGIFLATVTKFLEKNSIVPLKDPRMHEALNHHVY